MFRAVQIVPMNKTKKEEKERGREKENINWGKEQ